jgi:hypothetical protein
MPGRRAAAKDRNRWPQAGVAAAVSPERGMQALVIVGTALAQTAGQVEPEAAGWSWFMAVVVGTVILGLAIAYGQYRWRKARRDPATERRRDQATHETYE